MIGAIEAFSLCVSKGTDIKCGLVISLSNLATELFLVTYLFIFSWLHGS